MNRNFGHIDETSGEIIYAADTATVHGVKYIKPSAAMYALCSPPELPVSAAAPSDPAPDGYHYVPRGWEERDGAIRRVWILVADPPPPPRRWSRLSIKTALAQADILDAARQFLSHTNVENGYTAWEALGDCDYIEEGYPTAAAWNALLDGAAQALGKTRAEIDAFLDAIPMEA